MDVEECRSPALTNTHGSLRKVVSFKKQIENEYATIIQAILRGVIARQVFSVNNFLDIHRSVQKKNSSPKPEIVNILFQDSKVSLFTPPPMFL